MVVRVNGAFGRLSCTGLLLATPLLGGCSFLFVDAPPPSYPEDPPPDSDVKCTTSKAAPIIDTVITGLQAVRTIVAANASDADYSDAPISRSTDIGLGVAFTALFGSSAIYGYVVTGNCQDAKARRDFEPEAPYSEPPPPAPQSSPPPPPPAPARVCEPGATQQCVGLGACAGGQACAQDGMSWGPCQCAPKEEERD